MMKSKWLFSITLIVMILSGCASRAYEAVSPAMDMANSAPEMSFAEEETAQYNTTDSGIPIEDSTTIQTERVVIKNASIGIIVEDPAPVLNTIGRIAEESGGFIVNSNLYKSQTEQGLEVPAANITIRVPADLLGATLEEIKKLLDDPEKDVQYENVSGEDVTSEYTDLQSRLTNLEQAKAQLETIMDDAFKTEDVLSVYNELIQVTEQIEVLKGRIQYYNEASRLSSVEISIVARESIKELSIGGWQPAGVARDAIQALIDTLQFLANAAIWIILYILPVGLCLFIPVFLIFLAVRAAIRRRKQKKELSNQSEVDDISGEIKEIVSE